jgi:hypothetical protein
MQQAQGQSTAERLCGMAARPCDHQLRLLLDPAAPAQLCPVLEAVDAALEGSGHVAGLCACAGQRLMA